jgi:hypothetical protein
MTSSVSTSNFSKTIAPQAFLETYDLVPDVTTQYNPEWDDDEDLLVIDLDDPMDTYGTADESE